MRTSVARRLAGTKILFVIVFFFACTNTAIGQAPDSLKKVTHNFGLSWAIGPQFSMTDNYDYMIGLNVMLNSLLYHHIPIGIDMHAAQSNNRGIGGFPQFAVQSITSISLLPGYRFSINRYSSFQLQAGIGYGKLQYNYEEYSYTDDFFPSGDHEVRTFVGVPFRLSYELYHKMVGMQIYGSANLHLHYETAVGINFLLGRLK